MSPRSVREGRSGWLWISMSIVGLVIIAVVLIVTLTSGGSLSTTSSDGKPVVVMTPAPGSSTYHDGQEIKLSVGPNKFFTPYSRIIVIDCGDPGGTAAQLPINDTTCDGNTVQSYSILVNKDGSFSAPTYQLFSLPNTQLGESADNEPVCNQTHMCVLYVGQDQTNFRAPKLFSAPFTIVASHVPKKVR